MKRDDRIKQDMMELWRETFHDSMAYIRLVFDTYYIKGYTAVRYEADASSVLGASAPRGVLAASLLSVPYRFAMSSACSNWGGSFDESASQEDCGDTALQERVEAPALQEGKRDLRGLYLCGLATRPEFRRRGYMTDLMLEIEQRAREDGFDFTFLIPADKELAGYYAKRGYMPLKRTVWRVRYDGPVIPQNDVSVLDAETLDRGTCESLCGLLNDDSSGVSERRLRQCYTPRDMRTIVEENALSGGRIYLCRGAESNCNAKSHFEGAEGRFEGAESRLEDAENRLNGEENRLDGAAFVMPQQDGESGDVSKVVVQRIADRSHSALLSLLETVFCDYKGKVIEINDNQEDGIIDDILKQMQGNSHDVERIETQQTYGMVKWLREQAADSPTLSIALLLD